MTGRTRKASSTAVLLALMIAGSLAITGCSGWFESAQSEPGGTTTEMRAAPVAPVAEGEMGAVAEPQASTDSAADSAVTPEATKLVIVTKSMQMTVTEVDAAIAKIRALVRRDGGDITSLQVSTQDGGPVYPLEDSPGAQAAAPSGQPMLASLTIRVPAEKFSAFVDDTAKLGRVTSQSESNEDVTQQHVDLKARLGNLKATENRLRQFLNRARNVKEALEVERELSRVRGEIESMQAQIDYLERQAAMATVTLDLTEPQPLVRPDGQDWGVGDAFTSGVQGFVDVIKIFIVVVIATAPIWISGVLIAWLVVTLMKRRRRRAARSAGPESDAAGEDATPPDDARE